MILKISSESVSVSVSVRDSFFFMKPTTSEEISQIIRSCKNKLSSGCDNISMAIIKHTESCIAMPLAYICNLSIVNAHVPSGMKIA